MKTFAPLLFASAAAFVITMTTAAPVRAVEYAWCGITSTPGGSESCTFATIDQCRAYVAGAGFCQPNPRASALAEMPKRNPRR
jgi:Protein of unknown function (DUF3551)